MLQRQEGGELTEGRFFFLIVESSAWKKKIVCISEKSFPARAARGHGNWPESSEQIALRFITGIMIQLA